MLVTVAPNFPSPSHQGQLMQTNLTPQNPIHFQSQKQPDPANSKNKNNIIFILMPVAGFYYQEHYLSSSRTYWEILDVFRCRLHSEECFFVEAVILLLWNNQWLNGFKDPFEVWGFSVLFFFFSFSVQAFSWTTFICNISKDNILFQVILRSWQLINTFCSTILKLQKKPTHISINQMTINHVFTETNMR